MMVSLVLLTLAALAAVAAPRLLARAEWPEREPVVALWVWQCVVAAVLLCFALAMTFSAAAAWVAVRGHVFAPAPSGVVEAYALGAHRPWSAMLAVLLAAAWCVDGRDAHTRDPPCAHAPQAAPQGTARPFPAVARRGVRRRPAGRPGGRASGCLVAAGRGAAARHHHGRAAAAQGPPARCRTGPRAGPRPRAARLAAALLVGVGQRFPAGAGLRRVPGRDAPPGRAGSRRCRLAPVRPS